MARLGLAPESFAAENDRLIWCSLPGFAAADPRADVPGWEGGVSAAAALYPNERFSGDPRFSAVPLASNFAAFMASHRIAGALLGRLRHGRGQRIEVSLYEGAIQAFGMHAEARMSRAPAPSLPRRTMPVLTTRRCGDGSYLYFDTPLRGLQALLDRFLPQYDLLDLGDDEAKQLSADLDQLVAEKPAAEWERIGQEELQGSFGLVQSSQEWLHDQHALESRTVVEVDDPALGHTWQAGHPVLLSRTPATVRWARDAVDAGSPAAIEWLDDTRDDPAIAEGVTGLPLEGVRVLDASSLLAGPTTARILAQYGADVVKVDRAGIAQGDVNQLSDDTGALHGARSVSAGKSMMFLDLKNPKAREVLHTLADGVDVVHHNFTPAAAAKLGLAADQVRDTNPSVIFSTMSLHSHGGFRAEYRGHDMIAQMATGMGTRMGGDGVPKVLTIVVNDNAAGHLHAFGVMLALLHRNRTGEGQDVNGSLSRTATMHQLPFMVDFDGRVWDEPTGADAVGWHTLDRLYRAQDGWFYVAGGDPASGRARLAKVSSILDGVADVADGDLDAWLEARFAELPVEACVEALTAAGFGAHRYLGLASLLTDEYAAGHGLIAVVDHPGIGRAMGLGHPFLGAVDGPGPEQLATRRPGMDTIDVLVEHGFEDRVVELLRERAIGVGENPILVTTTSGDYWTTTETIAHMATPAERAAIVARLRNETPVPTHDARLQR
jgi:crotonobetainyl-CoA:carnitine CoA-transferase CaiB-like acyl-CoA transferase